jgi:antitoxin component of MazEF toxin-antitoxin module
MEVKMAGTPRLLVNKRLLKSGHGLYVALPSEVIEQWSLDKGDEVSISVDDEAIKIMPKKPEKIETISEEMIETYSATMKAIQARVTLDSEKRAIHLEFSGRNRRVINLFVQNLWRNLPVLLRLLGLGSVKESSRGDTGKGRRG